MNQTTYKSRLGEYRVGEGVPAEGAKQGAGVRAAVIDEKVVIGTLSLHGHKLHADVLAWLISCAHIHNLVISFKDSVR